MTTVLLVFCLIASLAACAAAVMAWRATSRPVAAQAPAELLSRLYMLEQALEKSARDARADQSNHRVELKQELAGLSTDLFTNLSRNTGDLAVAMKELRERTEAQIKAMGEKLEVLTKEGAAQAEALREKVRLELEGLRKGNEEKLEAMRITVDEKLQGALSERLDASFKQVSERLEQVHKGLGEMQSLATGVGDLKRVLTNVKSRGTWGEVQLQSLLEDMLTPEQFERQAKVRSGSDERVDFAVRLPGQDENGRVLLPIDCKYPQEDYERLTAAQEAGDPVAVEAAGKALERALKVQAKSIEEKYVHPPQTTNFAILYLPTEGLFAEVVRRAAFVQALQQDCRVTVAGPTTLSALLNSLRMGFTTLEIQKKSSEVWTVLGQTKAAFHRYGEAMDAVDKKLDEAKRKVAEVGAKHRAIVKSLKNVDGPTEAPLLTAEPILALAGATEEESEAA